VLSSTAPDRFEQPSGSNMYIQPRSTGQQLVLALPMHQHCYAALPSDSVAMTPYMLLDLPARSAQQNTIGGGWGVACSHAHPDSKHLDCVGPPSCDMRCAKDPVA
jgi:hypothetical protein